ncbi:NADAR [Pacmanvirus A23]|uniref:NADAR n=1 Tax=Pacmanvirus A23 TaxID=1932881 RepID=UPI000A095B93|nr:NADAR [Pacmanvirus A23]SIP86049.1 NADAR [Pacmanvirus A23]
MEFDQNEIDVILTDTKYQEQLERSKLYAKEQRKQGILRPNKIVDDELIEFYGSNRNGSDPFGKWFSNCVFARIIVDGKINNSSEHYFQREKFVICIDDKIKNWCRERKIPIEVQLKNNQLIYDKMATLSPVAVAKYGQTVRNAPIRSDWDEIRLSVMYKTLFAKFTQNKDFGEALKNTGDKVLIERAPTDSYWAVNNSGVGTNMLGVMLMVIRNVIE